MRLKPTKFLLHLREHTVLLWEDEAQNLVWARGFVFLGPQRIELTSRGARFAIDDGLKTPTPPQILEFPDPEWVSRVLIVSSDVTEPLEPAAVHVVDARLEAVNPIEAFKNRLQASLGLAKLFLDRPKHEDGVTCLDAVLGNNRVVVEYGPPCTFGVSKITHETGPFENPDQIFYDPDEALARVIELLLP